MPGDEGLRESDTPLASWRGPAGPVSMCSAAPVSQQHSLLEGWVVGSSPPALMLALTPQSQTQPSREWPVPA